MHGIFSQETFLKLPRKDAVKPENLQKVISTILYLFIAALAPAITRLVGRKHISLGFRLQKICSPPPEKALHYRGVICWKCSRSEIRKFPTLGWIGSGSPGRWNFLYCNSIYIYIMKYILWYVYEPCCKLSCIVSCIEVHSNGVLKVLAEKR